MITRTWFPGGKVWATLACAALASVHMHGCEAQEAPDPIRPVRAIQSAGSSGLLERTFPGVASASTEVNLSFRVGGPLIDRPADVGDELNAGDLVARIDPRDYEVRLAAARGQLERAIAARDFAQTEFDRIQRIMAQDPGATSEVALDAAKRELDVRTADIASLEAAVTAAEDQLRYTRLLAPFDGRVVATYAENFEDVLPKQAIVRVVDKARMEFDISVPESLIGYAPYVETVSIRFDAIPGREFEATVKEIGEEATRSTRTYPVTLVMDQPEDAQLLPGMAGDARIVSSPPDLEAGIAVPASAVFSHGSPPASHIWVCDVGDGSVSRRPVEVGRLETGGILITDGLEPGEWIVIAGVHSLSEGQRVRILDAETDREVGP